MKLRARVLVFVAAAFLTITGTSLLYLSQHQDQEPAGRVNWQFIIGISFGLIGILGIIGAMVVLISALLPHVLNAPDADELRKDTPPKPHDRGTM